jgi:hypothetical protein
MRIAGSICCAAIALLFSAQAQATVFDLKSQWSDAANPNGVWTYREGNNALPHVASFQSTLGGWTTAQPGWAYSENGTNRIPFFFKSNGSENFARDYLAGDIIVHTTDATNGVGNGKGNFLWTSPETGKVNVTGGVWMGRDIGRANHWALAKNGTILTEGDIASGDAFSRAAPFSLAAGTGGAAAVSNLPIVTGDQITLTFTVTGASGDFVGTNLTFTTTPVPEPASLGIAALAGAAWCFRRPRRD